MKLNWKDETSYSKGRFGRVARTWVLTLPWIGIVVTRHRDFDPEQWLLNCVQLGITDHELASKDVEVAKREALEFCAERCGEYMESLAEALKQ